MLRNELSTADVLGERGLRYKRNVLAAALVTVVILVAGVSLGEVSIFGVSLTKSKLGSREQAAWAVLALILGYQWLMLSYYGLTDWRIWRSNYTHAHEIPLRFVLFGIRSGQQFIDRSGNLQEVASIERLSGGLRIRYTRSSGPGSKEINARHIDINWIDHALIRRRLLAFFTVEFGIAYIGGLVSLVLAVLKATGSW